MAQEPDPAELYRLHARELRYFLGSRYDSDEAEDLVQEGFVRLLQVCSPERTGTRPIGNSLAASPTQPRAWLHRTCGNLAADAYDRRQVRERHAPKLLVDEASTQHDPARESAARQRLQRVMDALQQQPDLVRQAFLLNRIDGLSQREIAARLGVSKKTLERHVLRGLKAAYDALR